MPNYCKACLPGCNPIKVGRKDRLCGGCVKRMGVENPPCAPRPGQSNVNRDAKRAAVKLETRIVKAALIGIV